MNHPQPKSVGVAYLLWFFLGVIGVHKFYLGKVGMGVIYIFTLAFLGIGLLIDLFTLPSQVRMANLMYGGGNSNVNTNTQSIVFNMPGYPQASVPSVSEQASVPQPSPMAKIETPEVPQDDITPTFTEAKKEEQA